MCGIVCATSDQDIIPVLTQGLQRLEYRGYDSCGIAIHQGSLPGHGSGLHLVRSTDRVAALTRQVQAGKLGSATGIAHTRWATHGAPAVHNAHPLISSGPSQSQSQSKSKPKTESQARVALVHNGIIENHDALRARLQTLGYVFDSQTDTEVIVHLIDSLYQGDLRSAVAQSVTQLRGAYAIAVIHDAEPHRVVGARAGSPLVLGVGQGQNFLASDALALAGVSNQIIDLEEGDLADISPTAYQIYDRHGQPVTRTMRTVQIETDQTDLGPYQHYMQKEIFEQPTAVANTLTGIEFIAPELFGPQAKATLSAIDRVLILACGTSFYSGCVAQYWMESLAQLPCRVEVASEYRYRVSVPHPNTLVVAISQSGETADTLAALRHAQQLGMHHCLTICNVASSTMVRECQLAYVTRAGVEVGVASTKAFTSQLTGLFLLTLCLMKLNQRLNPEQETQYLRQLRHLPAAMQAVLALEPQVIAWSREFANKENALFLGRGSHYPIAMEGALKLKEISYIHAEAYAAGELKHGPLALVTRAMPVVAVAPNDALLEKLKSNLHEVRARGGVLYVLADADSQIVSGEGLQVIRLPEHYGVLSPLLHVLPLQLLAYHTACARGNDVDKPRNLAKSVTVE